MSYFGFCQNCIERKTTSFINYSWLLLFDFKRKTVVYKIYTDYFRFDEIRVIFCSAIDSFDDGPLMP